MKKSLLCCCLLCCVLSACAAAPGEGPDIVPKPMEIVSRTAAGPGVTVATLSNGLTVIVAEKHTAPVVCVRAYVRAGGLYEGEYLGCGLSHLLEHLVAKGAVHEHGPGETVKQAKQTRDRVDEIGGQSNAFTSLDDTGYYIAAAAGKTGACIRLIADWMARPEITREDFRREHAVVQRELEMGRDNVQRQFYYAHARNFFGTHPAGTPVIGLAEPLRNVAYEDVLDYHRRMYVPQNMVFAVAGDVKTREVLEIAAAAFAGFAPGRVPDLQLPEVAPVAGTRRVATTHPSATEAMQAISFRSIPLIHPDLYPLDVLSYVLTNGASSRLHRSIRREKKLVTGISSYSWTPAWGAGEFTITFRCEPDKADAAESAVIEELRKVVAEGVSAEELAKAKRQKVADHVYAQQTVEELSATLATDHLSTGDVEFSRRYTDRIQAVTAAQVRAVAEKYLDLEAMVITRMLPPKAAAKAAGAAGEGAAAETRTFRLPNGLRVVLHATRSVDLVSTVLATLGGLLVETPESNGLGTMMTALSTKGAGKRSAEDIAAFYDAAGGSIGADCGNNTFYWQSTVLSDSFEQALPIFADVVLRPTYPKKEIEILRPALLAQIQRTQEQWYGQLQQQFRKDFFHDSPLSMLTVGSTEVVGKADRQAVADYHARRVKAGSSVLAIYGNFDLARAESDVRKLFAAMPAGEVRTPELGPRRVAAKGETYVHPAKLKGTGIIVAASGMKLADVTDCTAMTVLDTIISGYRLPRGWLHEQLRGQGLVYVVHAYNWAALVPGAFVTYAHCEPPQAQRVADIIHRNLRRTLKHDFARAEVDEAVNMILTAELLENQSMSALAMQAALDELYGFGYDFHRTYEKRLRAVTPQEVKRVAQKYLSGGYLTTVVTPQPEKFVRSARPERPDE